MKTAVDICLEDGQDTEPTGTAKCESITLRTDKDLEMNKTHNSIVSFHSNMSLH